MQTQHQELLSDDAASERRLEVLDRIGCELVSRSLRAGHAVRMRAGGSSMLPALWPGDELVVTPLAGSIPSQGEIVLFTRDGRLFAHRVVSQAGDPRGGHLITHVITRGDSLDENDPPVRATEILGSVVALYRGGRKAAIGAARRSLAHRMLALAFRRFDLMRRIALRAHFARRRFWSIGQAECRA